MCHGGDAVFFPVPIHVHEQCTCTHAHMHIYVPQRVRGVTSYVRVMWQKVFACAGEVGILFNVELLTACKTQHMSSRFAFPLSHLK